MTYGSPSAPALIFDQRSEPKGFYCLAFAVLHLLWLQDVAVLFILHSQNYRFGIILQTLFLFVGSEKNDRT